MLFNGISHTAPVLSTSSVSPTRSSTSPPLQSDTQAQAQAQAPPSRPSRLRGLSYLRHHHHNNNSNPSSDSESKKSSRRLNPRRSNTSSSVDTHDTGSHSAAQTAQHNPETQASASNSNTNLLSPGENSDGRRRSTSAPQPPRLDLNNHTLGDQALAGQMDNGGVHDSTRQDRRLLPQIRFLPHNEASRGRPSLDFRPVSRVLPDDKAIIRVGRYSERDNGNESSLSAPSDAPVGFKSKVVSRRHCEFFYENSQWFVKDVKSSSGTFLNHIRLSQPNTESKPFPIKDGDIVQLGIDFKGGEEMIFRCVKIRIECNRELQKSLNKFNKSTHQQLRRLAKSPAGKDVETASKHSTECTICLNSIAPCQALFVAPCSHTWHYKCIRNLIEGRDWPYFTCPNCRARHDLEADIEEPEDFGFESDNEVDVADLAITSAPDADVTQALSPVPPVSQPAEASFESSSPGVRPTHPSASVLGDDDLAWAVQSSNPTTRIKGRDTARGTLDDYHSLASGSSSTQNLGSVPAGPERSTSAASNLLRGNGALSTWRTGRQRFDEHANAGSEEEIHNGGVAIPQHTRHNVATPPADDASGDHLEHVGPMTPRNDAGPFIFDGASGGVVDEVDHHDDATDSLAGRVEHV